MSGVEKTDLRISKLTESNEKLATNLASMVEVLKQGFIDQKTTLDKNILDQKQMFETFLTNKKQENQDDINLDTNYMDFDNCNLGYLEENNENHFYQSYENNAEQSWLEGNIDESNMEHYVQMNLQKVFTSLDDLNNKLHVKFNETVTANNNLSKK